MQPVRPYLPCGRAFFSGQPPLCLLFCDQKSSRKVPLLPRRGARPRGCSPLGTPKLWSRSKKAKPCRSAARFLTLFCFSPSGPSGANFMEVEEFWPQRGQSGKRKKSVKKNAALLHFLGFFPLTLLFGVLRGEQPLRRGPLPRNSGTFSLPFLVTKKVGLMVPPIIKGPAAR